MSTQGGTIRHGTLAQFLGLVASLRERYSQDGIRFVGGTRGMKPPVTYVHWYVCRKGENGEGSIEILDLPGNRMNVTLKLGTFPDPGLFGRFVDEFLEKMDRLGFTETAPAEKCAGKRKGAPPLEERVDVDEKREKALRYLKRIEGGTSKEIAAQLVGHSRKTLERWVKRLL